MRAKRARALRLPLGESASLGVKIAQISSPKGVMSLAEGA